MELEFYFLVGLFSDSPFKEKTCQKMYFVRLEALKV